MSDELTELEDQLGYRFSDRALLLLALTHPSYAAEARGNAETPEGDSDNQRLEFLGDAALQLALTDCLYGVRPSDGEGRLTKMRSALSKESALAVRSRALGVGQVLRLGRGEDLTGGRERPSNLADTLEAILGAIYLDGGLAPVIECCRHWFAAELADPERLLEEENPKGALQELTQDRLQTTPDYRVVRVSGPEHAPQFEVKVEVAGCSLGSAIAGNRKEAEKLAARKALFELKDGTVGVDF